MVERTISIIDYGFDNIRLYLFTALFSFGNVILPIIFHQFNLGGNIFLPIYFFTLIATYKFGWKMGVGIAILTPLANTFITGMPMVSMIPVVIFKGLALVLAAHIVTMRNKEISIMNLAIILLVYQALGMVFETLYFMDALRAMNSVIIAWPGLLIQLFAGYAVIRSIRHYGN